MKRANGAGGRHHWASSFRSHTSQAADGSTHSLGINVDAPRSAPRSPTTHTLCAGLGVVFTEEPACRGCEPAAQALSKVWFPPLTLPGPLQNRVDHPRPRAQRSRPLCLGRSSDFPKLHSFREMTVMTMQHQPFDVRSRTARWRVFALRTGALLIGAASVLGLGWAWSVVPASLGFGTRLAVVGTIGAIWSVLIAAIVGRVLLALVPRRSVTRGQNHSDVSEDAVVPPFVGAIERAVLNASGLERTSTPAGHGLDPSHSDRHLILVNCLCGWSGSIPDYVTVHLPDAWQQSPAQGPPTGTP